MSKLSWHSSVLVDIDGVSTSADFEVIEIIDDSNPYPALLGIEWAIDNAAVINLKKRQMTFEGKDGNCAYISIPWLE